MTWDQALDAIIRALLDKEPVTEGEQWEDRCGYCGGRIPQWPPDQDAVEHKIDCPWRRLKQHMEAVERRLAE